MNCFYYIDFHFIRRFNVAALNLANVTQRIKITQRFKISYCAFGKGRRLFARPTEGNTMFIPSEFAEQRDSVINAILAQYPLATLVTQSDQGLAANHIPILPDGDLHYGDDQICRGRLIGHIARRNQLADICQDESEVLVIFQAADGYISPNWYPTKAEHHKHVPTWNYQAIHFQGTIRFVDDLRGKTAIVGKLTKFFENKTNGKQGWKMADAPRDYLAKQIDGIIGFEINLTGYFAKSKLSQNRDKIDFDSVVANLDQTGNHALARAMTDLDRDKK